MTVNMAPVLWDRAVHLKEAWGTVLSYDIRGENVDPVAVHAAVEEADKFVDAVNTWFSPYLPHATINLYSQGVIPESGLPAEVLAVLSECRDLRDITEGRFDPWHLPGGLNLTGYVKGWAAQYIAHIFAAHGFGNVCVNAAGDVWCAGFQNPDEPWAVGLQHPNNPSAVFTTVHVTDAAVCTSGTYIHPEHIIDPATGIPVVRYSSVTVVGSQGGWADGLASAIAVEGENARRWFTPTSPLAQDASWEVILVDDEEGVVSRWTTKAPSVEPESQAHNPSPRQIPSPTTFHPSRYV